MAVTCDHRNAPFVSIHNGEFLDICGNISFSRRFLFREVIRFRFKTILPQSQNLQQSTTQDDIIAVSNEVVLTLSRDHFEHTKYHKIYHSYTNLYTHSSVQNFKSFTIYLSPQGSAVIKDSKLRRELQIGTNSSTFN